MKETYYVRRGGLGLKSSTKMSTPNRMDALKSAAGSAISNPGFIYVVCKGDAEIARFFVQEEN